MAGRVKGMGNLRGGRKLRAPELLEIRAAPGGGIAALMFGAAWFGFGDDEDESRSKSLGSDDPLWHLAGAAFLSEQTFHVSHSITQLERLDQLAINFWTKPAEADSTRTPDGAQLGAARQMAVEMVSGAVNSVMGESFDSSVLIGRTSLLDDLTAALALGQFSYMRSGLLPSGVNPDAAWGSQLWSQPTASSGGDGAAGAPASGSTSAGVSARAHGAISPLRLEPPAAGANPAESQVMMSGGSGGSGGGSEPSGGDDFYSGGHDEVLDVPDDGVLWNDDLGDEPGVVSLVTSPSHAASFSFSSGGGFTYEPPANWADEDSFTYQISNSVGTSQATVTIEIVNSPPWPDDDTYDVNHDTTLEVVDPSAGVRSNDSDNDHPLSALTVSVTDGPYHAQAFSYDADGTFTYEPTPGWSDTDTFTYTLHDGIDESDLAATVTIEVMNQAPMVDDDGTYTVTTGEAVIVAPGGLLPPTLPSVPYTVEEDSLRDNDYDPDGDEFSLPVETDPAHGTLSFFDWDLDSDGNPDGGFTYTAVLGYAGEDSFTYYADDGVLDSAGNPVGRSELATVSIEVMPKLNLTIHHGQSGSAVPEDDEATIGAFTVANGNNTDGDGVWDHIDEDGVIATPNGRDEVDLMKLTVDKPIPDEGGSVALSSVDYGAIRFWNDETKVNELFPDAYGDIWIATSELPKSVWIEVTSPSQSIGDYSIDATYGMAADTVKATGVWAHLSAVEHNRKTADQLLAEPEWADMTDPPEGTVRAYGGTGLIPNDAEDGPGVHNGIAMRFTVLPSGIGSVGNVKFDITRRKESSCWYLDAAGNVTADYHSSFPAQNEAANDDPLPDDDESDQPNANDHMFVYDAPGAPNDGPIGGEVLFVYRGNFEEFVRVRFDGIPPAENGVSGTRASAKYFWHARHRLELGPSGDWIRSTGDDQETDENDVGDGHIDIGDHP